MSLRKAAKKPNQPFMNRNIVQISVTFYQHECEPAVGGQSKSIIFTVLGINKANILLRLTVSRDNNNNNNNNANDDNNNKHFIKFLLWMI